MQVLQISYGGVYTQKYYTQPYHVGIHHTHVYSSKHAVRDTIDMCQFSKTTHGIGLNSM